MYRVLYVRKGDRWNLKVAYIRRLISAISPFNLPWAKMVATSVPLSTIGEPTGRQKNDGFCEDYCRIKRSGHQRAFRLTAQIFAGLFHNKRVLGVGKVGES